MALKKLRLNFHLLSASVLLEYGRSNKRWDIEMQNLME
jgi:hypothetical protein